MLALEEWNDNITVRSNTILAPLGRESIIEDSRCLNVLGQVILCFMLEGWDNTGRNYKVMVRENEGMLELALVFNKRLSSTLSPIQEQVEI